MSVYTQLSAALKPRQATFLAQWTALVHLLGPASTLARHVVPGVKKSAAETSVADSGCTANLKKPKPGT